MKINLDLTEHLEKLSKLRLRGGEREKIEKDMSDILEYMKMLDGVDVAGYNSMFTPIEGKLELRPDTPFKSDPSAILSQAPKKENGLISVPSIYVK